MNLQINQLVKSLLQKETLEQCSLQELEQFADRHPYFGAAQLLLTKKIQVEKPDLYDEQLQKTFLFFNNPLWVEHLLNETGGAEIIAPVKKEPVPVAQVEIPIVSEIKNEETEIVETIAATKPETIIEPSVTSVEKIDEHIIVEEPAFEIPALKMEAIDPAKAELVFEPFHTVDYFASQGIKFKEEEKPKDKFGLQLKSFTDWLKTMKRLPISEINKAAGGSADQSAVAEKKVEQLAEHSIVGKDVMTEAMAEVWEKQGNVAKAIEVYGKLSLLYPSKSPYFAAKIDDLKKTN